MTSHQKKKRKNRQINQFFYSSVTQQPWLLLELRAPITHSASLTRLQIYLTRYIHVNAYVGNMKIYAHAHVCAYIIYYSYTLYDIYVHITYIVHIYYIVHKKKSIRSYKHNYLYSNSCTCIFLGVYFIFIAIMYAYLKSPASIQRSIIHFLLARNRVFSVVNTFNANITFF